jgi:SAM-dependent methyltransferase
MTTFHESPSEWVLQHAQKIRPGGRVLDLACGYGRHARWLAAQGFKVLAVDRDQEALASMQDISGISVQACDLEATDDPLEGKCFDAIVVSRYLYRPLLPQLPFFLASSGVLIYETFMCGQEQLGRPRNPDFLLYPDELLQVYSGMLEVLAFEQGLIGAPQPAYLQRICACKV